MHTIVLSGPAPIATPADIAGSHSASDVAVARIIAAVQATIDGPTGWLGRAIGEQSLRLMLSAFPCSGYIRLYSPVKAETVTIRYLDPDAIEHDISPSDYRVVADKVFFGPGFSVPPTICAPDAVRIDYQAGYSPAIVPPEAKHAVILMAQHLKAIGGENMFLKVDEVEGVGRQEYALSSQYGEIVRTASEHLLKGLRVYGS